VIRPGRGGHDYHVLLHVGAFLFLYEIPLDLFLISRLAACPFSILSKGKR